LKINFYSNRGNSISKLGHTYIKSPNLNTNNNNDDDGYMENTSAIDYQASQISLFMANIHRDLEDHVLTKSEKYDFNFEQETPMNGDNNDFQWFEVSNFSKSEATGKKPRMNMNNYDRTSTGDTTLHSIHPDGMMSARGGMSASNFSIEMSA